MNDEFSLKKAVFISLGLHCLLGGLLFIDVSSPTAVLHAEAQNQAGQQLPVASVAQPEPEAVKAVSVDSAEVMKAVNQLKEERAQQRRIEQARQQALAKQAEMAKRARIQEQQRLVKLKEEAEKIAIARKKQLAEEQARLKQLTAEKEKEAKRLAELKAKQTAMVKQQQEAERLAKVSQQKAAAEEAEKRRQTALEQARLEGIQQAKLAGEVNKYKALILNAIGQHWILPEHADKNRSSQFRIRLAPDGAVLEVSLMRSSGDPILDRSAQTAIYKASPLPVPSDIQTFNLFRDISLTVRPENVRA